MITFFDRSEGIGGSGVLIVNLASSLYFNYKQEFKIICGKESFIRSRLQSLQVPFIHIDIAKEHFHDDLTEDDVLIKTDLGNINWIKNSSAKIIYWEIFPSVFANTLSSANLYFKRRLIKYLGNNDSLFFMDINCINELKGRKYIIDNPKLVPIPIEVPGAYKAKTRHSKKHFTLTYIGRSVAWKIYPVKKILDDISQLTDSSFKVVIFCDDEEKYKAIIKKEYRNIELVYLTNVHGSELNDFLKKYSDLHFAMGTSALESAKEGIPTVLMDYFDNPFPEDYKYKFLFEVQGFSLGYDVSKITDQTSRKSMLEICSILLDLGKYNEVGMSCYEYVKRYHNLQLITKELIDRAVNSKAYIKKIYRFIWYAYYEAKLMGSLNKYQ